VEQPLPSSSNTNQSKKPKRRKALGFFLFTKVAFSL
jgi:hypothetical protein